MQNSAVYRRGFVVPLSEEAEQALIINDVDHNTAVEFFEIPDQEAFDELWNTGLFSTINANIDVILDDYEEDVVEESQVGVLKEVVELFRGLPGISSESSNAINELLRLCEVALEHKKPIFFVL